MVLLGKMNKREESTKKRILKDHQVGKREKEETRGKDTEMSRARDESDEGGGRKERDSEKESG
jgi:hypothetical protein